MRKIFSFVAAMVIATSTAFAGTNLFNPATTTLETWFGDANWASEEGAGTAVYDNATGITNVTINTDRTGQWKAQVKLITDMTALDPTKQYDFAVTMTANADISNVTVKVFDASPDGNQGAAQMFYKADVSLVANTALTVSATNVEGKASNGVIVFDFGSAHAGNTIEIKDVYLGESDVTTISCADVMTKQDNDEFVLGAFDVVYVNGSYIYIKDASGSALIYKYNYGLNAGDHVAAGLAGKLSIYNGLYEIVPTSALADLTVTDGTAPKIEYATAVPGQANMNAVVVYKDVHFDADCAFTNSSKTTLKGVWGTDTIAFYNTFKIAQTFEAAKAYNITAANSIYNSNYQAYFIAAEEYEAPTIKPDTVDHGLYNPATATITSTYFATGGNWAADNESSAELVEGQLFVTIAAEKSDRWQSQVFLNPGFLFEEGKEYKMEFDLETNNQLGGVTLKIGDGDDPFYESYPNDNVFLANTDTHYDASPINVTADIEEAKRVIIFAFGWVPAGTEIRIHNIRIVETGTYVPVEEKMYIKHPWGTGADADWTWQEMQEDTYSVYKAYSYEGKWGGVGCNIADNAEGNDAAWYAADKIQYLSPEDLVLAVPAVGTDVKFVYVPDLKDSQIVSPVKVIYTPTAIELIPTDAKAAKMLIDGQVYLLRGGKLYNALGTQVK